MIEPFEPIKTRPEGTTLPSHGLSSGGYDARMGRTLWIAKPGSEVIDLAHLPRMEELFEVHEADSFVLMPGMFVLLHTMEYFRIPRDITGTAAGKSTLRRLGKVSDMTPLEAGWHGNLVVELNFTFPRPIKVYAGMGICQVLFNRMEAPCRRDYVDLGAKYHGQTGVTPAR
jgi:dCTP deaminase